MLDLSLSRKDSPALNYVLLTDIGRGGFWASSNIRATDPARSTRPDPSTLATWLLAMAEALSK